MAEIKTIFWDIGGVLLTNGWDEHQRARVLGKYGVDMSESELRHHEANPPWERGEITAKQYFDRTLFFKKRDFTFEDIWPDVKAQSTLLHAENFDILKSLATSGNYSLAVLSNESRELNEHRYAKWQLKKYFEYFISSCYVGMLKPNVEIYQLALDLAQTAPQQTIFIDDRIHNTEPAASLGMDAIHFESPAQLRLALSERGIHTPAAATHGNS